MYVSCVYLNIVREDTTRGVLVFEEERKMAEWGK